MKQRIAFFLVAMLTVVASQAQDNGLKRIELTASERAMVKSSNNFAVRLFRETRVDGESQILSPLSITYALGMLNNGAQGVTQEEINKVLGFGEAGADGINQFCLKLLQASATLDKETKVSIADNIYVNAAQGVKLKTPFAEKAKTYFDATPETRDFADGQTRDVINQWASDHTEGMITEVLKKDEFDEGSVSYLLNAIYFKGAWCSPFKKENTQRTSFDNGRAEVQMMRQNGEFMYAQNKVFQSVILPYGNGAYQMTVYLPQWGKTVTDVLNALEGGNWETDYQSYDVLLQLPRIETTTDQRLEQVMAKLGMPNAFSGGEGFNEFCYVGDDESNSVNVVIDIMKQVAKIELDEEGTEASAVTVIGTKNSSMVSRKYAEFIADRPFLYTISEQSTGAIFFIGQFTGDPLKNQRHDITLTDEEKELVKGSSDFAFRLMKEARDENSQIMSPLSVTYALGMLNNGATGQTQREINEVLGFGNSGADGINQFCRKMLTEATTLDEQTKVVIANTVYVNKDFELNPEFVAKANAYYDAQPETRDFHDGKTCDVINQWASDHTQGMIQRVLSQDTFNPDAVSYLLNAIYFKGVWTDPFNAALTTDEPFYGSDDVPMMHNADAELRYKETDSYQAVRLPYGNEAYTLTVFLPWKGVTIGDVLSSLDADSWHKGFAMRDVDLKLPRFETETHLDLKTIMSNLGMPSAFDKTAAEFDNFCNVPGYIGLMKQVAKIKLDEQGTEAAAVTVIGYEATAFEPQKKAVFHANRPFLYIISEQSTGAIFFIGQFTGATTSAVTAAAALPHHTDAYSLSGQRLSAPPARGIYIERGRKVLR